MKWKLIKAVNYDDYDVVKGGSVFYIVDKEKHRLRLPNGKPHEFSYNEGKSFITSLESGWNPAHDICQNRPQLPHRVYIVAPGLKGAVDGGKLYRSIPDDAFVIVINKAIELPVNANVWMVGDPIVLQDDWFTKAYDTLIRPFGIEHIGANRTIPVMVELLRGSCKDVKAYYKLEMPTRIGDGKIIKTGLRAGMTTSGCALQWAFMCGAREIYLLGVDYCGRKYYDGTENTHYLPDRDRGEGVWDNIDSFDAVIKWLERHDCKVFSLSKTSIVTRVVKDIYSIPPAPKPQLNGTDTCSGRIIYDTRFRFDGDVYIVGTGPNGREHYKNIPRDATVIVVNQAINIFGIPKSIWMCEDTTLLKKKWFQERKEFYFDREYTEADLTNKALTVPIFMSRDYMDAPFIFDHTAMIDDRNIHFEGNRQTFGGATIACRATQVACHLGARRIIYCGIDLFGAHYFDGSDADGQFYDARVNAKWLINAKGFGAVIDWFKRNKSIEFASMSETSLNVPRLGEVKSCGTQPHYNGEISDLPKVAYLSMCYDPVDNINACAWCLAQDYPNEKKVLYLVHQQPYPEPLIHDMPIKIIELYTEGKWPALWMLKLKTFIEECREDIGLIFDQDDCWMPDYTRKAIAPLIESDKMNFAWCFDMYHVRNAYVVDGKVVDIPFKGTLPENGKWHPAILKGPHQSAIGTLAFKVPRMREVCVDFFEKYPTGLVNLVSRPATGKYKERASWSGPIDNYFKRMLMNDHEDELTEHEGNGRVYFIHSSASSKSGRRAEGYINYETGRKE